METALIEQLGLDESHLDALLKSREQAVRAYLLQAQDIEESRVQPQTAESAEEEAETRPGAVVFDVG